MQPRQAFTRPCPCLHWGRESGSSPPRVGFRTT